MAYCYDGKTYETIKEMAEEYGIDRQRIYSFRRRGWSLEDAMQMCINDVRGRGRLFEYNGKLYRSPKALAEEYGLPWNSLAHYIQRCKTIEEAVDRCKETQEKKIMLWGKRYQSRYALAIAFGIRETSISARIHTRNMTLEEIILELLQKEPICFEGKTYNTLVELCAEYQVQPCNVFERLKYGKTLEEGKPTWRTVIRMDIRDAIGVSFSWSQFVKEMEKRGYTWKLNRKYPALKTPDMERYVRLRSLGKGYGEAEIREKILRPKIQQVYGKTQVQFPKRKLTGLQKLYFSYLYRMGVLQQKPKRISYAVRSDIRKLDLRIRQMEFLQKEGINTREELAAYRKPLEEQVLSLMKERRTLYRKEPGGMRIQEINGELKELRKKIRLSQQIEIQSKEMEERLKQAKEQEQIQESSGKQRREEERKR